MCMKASRDTGEREMVWEIYKQLDSLCRKRAQISKLIPSSLLADFIVEVSKDNSEELRLELLVDKCYEETRVPASIDE